MRTTIAISRALATAGVAVIFSFNLANAQKLAPAQLPAPVLGAFNKNHPKAMDVEWKLRGTQYKVEFETGLLFRDHEVWYDADGKELRHEEEISASDLPEEVAKAIAADFPGFRTDDVERITMEGMVSYVVELKLMGQPEWKVAFDAAGKLLEKAMD